MPTSKVSPPINGLAGVSPVPPPHPSVGGEHTTTPTGPEGAAPTTAEKIPDRLTVEEELVRDRPCCAERTLQPCCLQALQNNFLSQIIRIASAEQAFGNLPPEVAVLQLPSIVGYGSIIFVQTQATAAIFFKRYYHNISLMQKDPRVLL